MNNLGKEAVKIIKEIANTSMYRLINNITVGDERLDKFPRDMKYIQDIENLVESLSKQFHNGLDKGLLKI